MPKPRQRLDSQLRQDLYLALQRKTSISLKTKSDCTKVSTLMIHGDLLFQQVPCIESFISNNSQTRPFTTTLNEIAHFLGFKSFDDFSQWAQTNCHSIYSNASADKNSNEIKSLLSINIELKNYDALKVFFDQYLDRFNDAIFFQLAEKSTVQPSDIQNPSSFLSRTLPDTL